MERAEAARLLGVDVDAEPSVVRGAFRARVRARHPDAATATASGPLDGLVQARDVLLAPPSPSAAPVAPPAAAPSDAARTGPPIDARVDGDGITLRADPATVVARLVEAGHELGEITYLDRSSGLVEILLQVQEETDPGPAACSLVASLQGRMDGVEVFCTVERLDGHPAPPIAPLVVALAEAMGVRPERPAG